MRAGELYEFLRNLFASDPGAVELPVCWSGDHCEMHTVQVEDAQTHRAPYNSSNPAEPSPEWIVPRRVEIG